MSRKSAERNEADTAESDNRRNGILAPSPPERRRACPPHAEHEDTGLRRPIVRISPSLTRDHAPSGTRQCHAQQLLGPPIRRHGPQTAPRIVGGDEYRLPTRSPGQRWRPAPDARYRRLSPPANDIARRLVGRAQRRCGGEHHPVRVLSNISMGTPARSKPPHSRMPMLPNTWREAILSARATATRRANPPRSSANRNAAAAASLA